MVRIKLRTKLPPQDNYFYSKKVLRRFGYSDFEINQYYQRLDDLRRAIHPQADLKMTSREFFVKCADSVPIFCQSWMVNRPKGLILCQHGNSVHGDLFYPFADEMVADGWSVISIDNRGHGRSGPRRGLFDEPEKMVHIYTSIMRSWRQKHPNTPVIMFGQSLGCIMVAKCFSKKNPRGIVPDALILNVPPYEMGATRYLRPAEKLIKLTLLPIFTILGNLFYKMPVLYHRFYEPIPTYIKEFQVYDKNDPLINRRHYLITFRSLGILFMEFHHLIPNISVPTLILQGTGDSILDPTGARLLYDEINSPDKTIKFYSKANHSQFMDENSQQIYTDIHSWANSLALRWS